MRRSLRQSVALVIAAAIPLLAAPTDHQNDIHFSDSAAPLYHISCFAHGYVHGYEDGFHIADQAIQMGRVYRADYRDVLKTLRQAKPSKVSGVADRDLFSRGYRAGLAAGYNEGVSGREFHAISNLRELSTGIGAKNWDKTFDTGFADGYRAASAPSLKQLPAKEAAMQQCESSARGNRGEYCEGYVRGLRLGFIDAHTSSVAAGSETAERSR
jgi:hypothetical protein